MTSACTISPKMSPYSPMASQYTKRSTTEKNLLGFRAVAMIPPSPHFPIAIPDTKQHRPSASPPAKWA